MGGSLGRRAGAAALAAALLAALVARPAVAGGTAQATGTAAVTSSTWSVIPTTSSSGTPSPGSVSIGFSHTLVLTTPPQYFYAANTGTRSLVRTSYEVDGIGGALLGNPTITLTACVGGTWNTGTNVCSGTPTAIGSFTAASPGPTDVAAAPTSSGSRLHIQAAVSNFGLLGSFTAVFSTMVTSSGAVRQLSGPLTTNA
ncbi:MAG TPA: hypothetical protein VFJ85_08155 [Acidimicrobiales bacterium]|nr:hypothetical protein [Acidimicrobiales bacterium]